MGAELVIYFDDAQLSGRASISVLSQGLRAKSATLIDLPFNDVTLVVPLDQHVILP
jgi:hypothetical protein